MDRLVNAAKARGITVFARIDHGAGANEAGLVLRPTELLVFGSARAGTPLMQAGQTIDIDLPLKALVRQDAGGTTIVDALGATVLMVTHDVDEAILLSDRVVMMTNGPAARLREILAIDLPRPRDRLAITADPACVAYRQAMIRFLHGRHRRADA